jgi:hypothetical protein
MGDVFINYNEYGKKYLKRIFYLNIMFYIIAGIALLLFFSEIIVIVSAASFLAVISLIYALYFIHKNPPIENLEDYPSEERALK